MSWKKCSRLRTLARLEKPSAFEQILKPVTSADWKTAEENRSLGYNGLLKCTKERRADTGQKV